MKKLLFSIYAFFFNLRAKKKIDDNRIALVSMHNANFTDSLYEIEKELNRRGNYHFLKISRSALDKPLSALKFCTIDAYRLGGARYIFLNDNFMPLAKLNLNKDTKVVQLWHGQGAFKKFGLSISRPAEIRQREIAANNKLSYVVCSSQGVKSIYAEAFGVPPEKVIATGTPNEDYYFDCHNLNLLRSRFDKRYPECTSKVLVLYAPTFREDAQKDSSILRNIDFERLANSFPFPVEILVRLHPQVRTDKCNLNNIPYVVDVTDYKDVNEICLLSSILITDYSSICMDFSLQNKPMIFYAYDLEDYVNSRDFYFSYESYVPGPIAKDMNDLCNIALNDFNLSKEGYVSWKNSNIIECMDKFKAYNFDEPDGSATANLLGFLNF